MLAVLLLSQVEVLLWVGIIPPSLVQLLGVIGLLAFVAIVEIDKAVSWKHIARFARDYSFHGDGNGNGHAPTATTAPVQGEETARPGTPAALVPPKSKQQARPPR